MKNEERPEPRVVPLPRREGAPAIVPAPPASPHPRGHGLVVTMMFVFAVIGIAVMLAFITIGWTEQTARYLMVGFALSIVGFIACASMAVFTAARSTYTPVDRDVTKAGVEE